MRTTSLPPAVQVKAKGNSVHLQSLPRVDHHPKMGFTPMLSQL